MAVAQRVLYIEDEKFFADTLENVLSQVGYDVMQAPDGEVGLKVAREWKPDLILLDLLLPKIEGFEVLRQLKADLATSKIPIVVLSNLNSESDVKRAKDLGALHFFVKAVTMPTSISSMVKEIVGAPPSLNAV
ncbi:MAG: response regulator [Patescibacteria group bacterium]